MRFLYTFMGALASMALICVSAGMNFRFGYQLGNSYIDSMLLGCASVAVDLLKALLPFFIGFALIRKHPITLFIGCIAWTFFTVFSLTSAIGFSSLTRAEYLAKREISANAYSDLRKERKFLEQRIKNLGNYEPAALITSRIEALKFHWRWNSSRGCTDITVVASRILCQKIKAEEGKLALSKLGHDLENKLSAIKQKLSQYDDITVTTLSDPQVQALAFFTGIQVAWIKHLLIALMAIVTEVGSGLGLFLSLGLVGANNFRLFDQRLIESATPIGRVTAFCQQCLNGSSDGPGLTLEDLYIHYKKWCSNKNYRSESFEDFAISFKQIVTILDLTLVNFHYQGIDFKSTT